MIKNIVKNMNLREKIGQTGFPSPAAVTAGAVKCGSLTEYFRQNPFTGIYVDRMGLKENTPFPKPQDLADGIREINSKINVPLLVAADAEYGACGIYKDLHRVSSNMSLGAAMSEKLTYQRFNLWAKELRSCGVNWAFGPVLDMLNNFFDVMGVRCISDDPQTMTSLIPSIVSGIQDARLAATPKHFPGSGWDYRDPHFCNATNDMSLDEWYSTYGKIWKCAVDSGADSFMISHMSFPAVDPSLTPMGAARPATASKRVIDILRKEMSFDGVIVTDAVDMKGCASSYEHDDVYIECFNAGNDIILFVRDDYIDVIEKAILDGRISIERLDESVERILRLKEKIGLFDPSADSEPLSEAENAEFDSVNLEISKRALTLVQNRKRALPFDNVKKATIIAMSPYEPFVDEMDIMRAEFAKRGIEAKVITTLGNKGVLEEISRESDLIIYACYLAMSQPQGMSFYSTNMITLFNSLSYGKEKSIAVSFGAPSIYYNYFENADIFINAYSMDRGTIKAVVGGILGDFELTGRSPVELRPRFAKPRF